jgi:hypothetical protein
MASIDYYYCRTCKVADRDHCARWGGRGLANYVARRRAGVLPPSSDSLYSFAEQHLQHDIVALTDYGAMSPADYPIDALP